MTTSSTTLSGSKGVIPGREGKLCWRLRGGLVLVAVFPNPFGLPGGEGGTHGLVPFNLGLTVNWLLEVKINIEGNTWSEVKPPSSSHSLPHMPARNRGHPSRGTPESNPPLHKVGRCIPWHQIREVALALGDTPCP